MSRALQTILGLGVAALMGLSPVAAMADSLGVYQTTDRKMDFGLESCGSNNTQLCVTLLAARGTAVTRQTKPFIGKYVVDHANAAGRNAWKGSMTIQGQTLDGTLTLKPGKSFVMSGCVYVVMCSDFTLIPAKQ